MRHPRGRLRICEAPPHLLASLTAMRRLA
uniref:Uncharacterized protein n=1 Tax=Arundo donax TaxID=35708 RepID=A0A0A8XXQ8_ARUDO